LEKPLSPESRLETAAWIAPVELEVAAKGKRPAYWLRTVFDGPDALTASAAFLTFSARGICEIFINGQPITDEVLLPGFMQYNARIPFRKYAVGSFLNLGTNVIAVLLADGWFRGQNGIPRAADQWGAQTSFVASITSGTQTICTTDGQWLFNKSHIVSTDLIAGQVEDRCLVDSDIHTHIYDVAKWDPVVVAKSPTATLVPYDVPPVRRIEVVPAKSISELRPGVFIVDFAQNLNGWCRFRNLGPRGTHSILTHAEWLAPDGDITTEHLAPFVPILPEKLTAGMIDEVCSAGVVGDVFEPSFTTHGFRYVRIEGNPGPIILGDLDAVAVHSDLTRTGWFTCDNDRINKLHDAAVWSMRSNMTEIPTDCPQRERSGWVGDWQLFAPTAAFLYDVKAFTRKWLADVRLDQRADGAVANISPASQYEGFEGPLAHLSGSAGWGDVVVLGPLALYEAYGDRAVLDENVDAMRRWIEFGLATAANGRSAARCEANEIALPHEKYLWDTGFHWGEWLEPNADLRDFFAFLKADKSEVASAYLAHSCAVMSGICNDLTEAARYQTLANEIRTAWQTEFLANGLPITQTQAAYVRALRFGLVNEDDRSRVAARLVELIREARTTVGTGFLSTVFLLPVLADAGYTEVAYELLLQGKHPGWMYMIDLGATTVWERWEGVDAKGIPHESLNHYSKAAVVSFLHNYTAGLKPTSPGYDSFEVKPHPGGGLTKANLRFDSRHGTIEVRWTMGDTFELSVVVPNGTVCTVTMPSGQQHLVNVGAHSFSEIVG
jgi:alpha-L-rhamnosidase